mgnify:CR=1 FL=1
MIRELTIPTGTQAELVDITPHVREAVRDSGVITGVCYLFVPHTTAGLTLNENWDPSVESDVAMVLDHIVPPDLPYRHSEGNSAAHAKSLLVGTDHFVFIHGGQLELGQWQGIFLAEFDGPRHRSIWIKVVCDIDSA